MLNIFGLSPIFKPPYIGTELNDYLRRVQLDSGVVASPSMVDQWVGTAQANGFFDPTQMLIAPIFGYKERISAPYSFLSKLYSLRLAANDAAQTIASNQPYKAGNIAPNEVLSSKVPNGSTLFVSHAEISRTSTQEWTWAAMLGNNSTSAATNVIYSDTGGNTAIYYKNTTNVFAFKNASGTTVSGTVVNYGQIGKNTMLHFVAKGDDTLEIYVNKVLFDTLSVATDAVFQQTGGQGVAHYYRMQFGAMTPAQITAEYDLLRSWIPEIESVTIGSQVWASSNLDVVATPLGNVIPEVTLAATWATATTLYDNAYAAASGDAAAKHYAGVKAAAMWCYFDNSTANGAIYGKILNGYAIKLLRLDMITANYGYKPPLQADWDALETYLDVDAGNDVKHNGTTFWSAPNGGTNSSGLTILPGGYRNELGAFVGLNDEVYMITADETDDRIGGYARLIKD